MKISAGLVIIQDNKILLVHPTGAKWVQQYSIPKGEIDGDEDYLQTAIRETYEEIGVEIDKKEIDKTQHKVEYRTKTGKCYKTVYYYVVRLTRKIDVKKDLQPQLDEVDWIGFLNKEEALKKILQKQQLILNHLEDAL